MSSSHRVCTSEFMASSKRVTVAVPVVSAMVAQRHNFGCSTSGWFSHANAADFGVNFLLHFTQPL
ncbi:hypothetical protein HanXRQr2_Chr06g0274421 [Helianthus annuus]|uniref:Uncharacterized protein n=1 Tax=Helianthus annuus TaxID=4232 RepID=A0A9K3NL51_HELAN|nr:hypothetical protein HanXRQr2_Chr06g0274421 [Helianthus annuus]KAJ0916731.1 hypothetical protein HanPSC8_Chr06g0265201 [Helianthus annuus]